MNIYDVKSRIDKIKEINDNIYTAKKLAEYNGSAMVSKYMYGDTDSIEIESNIIKIALEAQIGILEKRKERILNELKEEGVNIDG